MMCSYTCDVETLLNYGLYEDGMQIPVPTGVFQICERRAADLYDVKDHDNDDLYLKQ
jgi:hypothetical protein